MSVYPPHRWSIHCNIVRIRLHVINTTATNKSIGRIYQETCFSQISLHVAIYMAEIKDIAMSAFSNIVQPYPQCSSCHPCPHISAPLNLAFFFWHTGKFLKIIHIKNHRWLTEGLRWTPWSVGFPVCTLPGALAACHSSFPSLTSFCDFC